MQTKPINNHTYKHYTYALSVYENNSVHIMLSNCKILTNRLSQCTVTLYIQLLLVIMCYSLHSHHLTFEWCIFYHVTATDGSGWEKTKTVIDDHTVWLLGADSDLIVQTCLSSVHTVPKALNCKRILLFRFMSEVQITHNGLLQIDLCEYTNNSYWLAFQWHND